MCHGQSWTWYPAKSKLIVRHSGTLINRSWVQASSINKQFWFKVILTFVQYNILKCHVPNKQSMVCAMLVTWLELELIPGRTILNTRPWRIIIWTISMDNLSILMTYWVLENTLKANEGYYCWLLYNWWLNYGLGMYSWLSVGKDFVEPKIPDVSKFQHQIEYKTTKPCYLSCYIKNKTDRV